MKKVHMNFWTDAAAFACFIFLTSTGVLMRYLLPAGSGHWQSLWGMDRHEWGDIHYWIAVGFLLSLAIHVALHWRWIVGVIKGKAQTHSGRRFAVACVALVAVMALAIAPLVSTVKKEPKQRGHGRIQSNINQLP